MDWKTLSEYKSIQRWFDRLEENERGTERTKVIYAQSMAKFLIFHNIDNPNILVDKWRNEYDLQKREMLNDKYVKMIEDFTSWLKKKYAKSTVSRTATAIKSFFKHNRVLISYIAPRFSEAEYPDLCESALLLFDVEF